LDFESEEKLMNKITKEETENRIGFKEYHILKRTNHKNITRLYEIIIDVELDKIVFVMEYADLGTLMRMNENKNGYLYNFEIINFIMNKCLELKIFLDEKNYQINFINDHTILIPTAKYILTQLAASLLYLHQSNIAHRDIKPDNIMMKSEDKNIKLVDFSISIKTKSRDETINSIQGTEPFQSPETHTLYVHNPFKSDIYALGATIYVFLFNRFEYEFDESKFEDIKLFKNYDFQFYEILKIMLEPEMNKRPFIEELLNHDFFNSK
jgi:serine/threonine protein kinase